MASINGVTLLSATVTMPRVGAWHLDFEADDEVELSGAVTVDIDGVAFVGTILRSSPFAGRTRGRVVGGAGDLSRELGPFNYAGPKVRSILADILGRERISATASSAVLDTSLPAYERIAGIASHALVTLLDVVGATWRVLSDGTIWIGQETWPEVDPPHVLEDEDWYTGVLTIAPETPSLRPGVTFRTRRIEQVVHTLAPGGLRTEAHLTSLSGSLGRFLAQIRQGVDYAKRWPARVARVNSDGTIQVVPDDTRIKGSGLDRVRVRSGVPGKVTPVQGARCLVGFDAGDPSRAYAEGWDGTEVESVAIADGFAPAARVGSTVDVFFPPVMVMNGLVNGTLPFAGTLTIPMPGIGIIKDGNPKVKL